MKDPVTKKHELVGVSSFVFSVEDKKVAYFEGNLPIMSFNQHTDIYIVFNAFVDKTNSILHPDALSLSPCTAVKRHCTDCNGIWTITSKKVLGWVQRLEVANVQGFHPLFHESDLAPLFRPLSALSLRENTLSG